MAFIDRCIAGLATFLERIRGWRLGGSSRDEYVEDASIQAWNNFVFHSRSDLHEKGSPRWAAATASQFMGLACNGGMNYFLTYSPEFDARDVADALRIVGAIQAADQLAFILGELGRPLLASSEEERWKVLEECWLERLDDVDYFGGPAYGGLMSALEAHVAADAAFYRSLGPAR